MAREVFAALDGLERRFDGPIPEALRRLALAGSARALRARQAAAEAAFFTGLIRSQLRAIRLRRDAGEDAALLLRDLALYRRERRFWRRAAALLCR